MVLVAIPTSKQIEQVLAAAILHFAECDRAVFEWVVEHQAVLAPELELFCFVKRRVFAQLADLGWTKGRDFELNIQSRVLTNKRPEAILPDCFSRAEWRLVDSIFEIEEGSID